MSIIKRVASLLASVGAFVSLLLALLLTSFGPTDGIIHPRQMSDLKKVSAIVLMSDSLGTATILRSGPKGSDFLTNAHVCDGALTEGALIVLNGMSYEVASIKPSHKSDLCLMHVNADLEMGIVLAPVPSKTGDEIISGGYPLGLPLVLEKGYVSGVFNISEDLIYPEFVLLTSFLVQPGHSGSGVFNSKGELIGVIVAMKLSKETDSMGFGLAVPHKQVKRFILQESPMLPWTPVPSVPPRN